MLVPGKMQHVICTGNIGSNEQLSEIRELAPNVHIVAGDDCDEGTTDFPETRVVQVGDFRVGVVHGHQVLPWGNQDALARMRRKLHVHVLISGHTHQQEITEYDGYHHINPVRATIVNDVIYLEGSWYTNCVPFLTFCREALLERTRR